MTTRHWFNCYRYHKEWRWKNYKLQVNIHLNAFVAGLWLDDWGDGGVLIQLWLPLVSITFWPNYSSNRYVALAEQHAQEKAI